MDAFICVPYIKMCFGNWFDSSRPLKYKKTVDSPWGWESCGKSQGMLNHI